MWARCRKWGHETCWGLTQGLCILSTPEAFVGCGSRPLEAGASKTVAESQNSKPPQSIALGNAPQGLVLLEEPGLWPQHLCCVEGQWGVTMPVGICTLCPLGAC